MYLSYCFLFSAVLYPVSIGQYSKDYAGPFNVIIERIGRCKDTGSSQFYMHSVRISKVGRYQYVYSTNITLTLDLPQNLSASSDIAKWGNGGWRPHFFQFDFDNYCQTLENYLPTLFEKLHTAYGKKDDKCSIPKGSYELKDFSISSPLLRNLPEFPYGKYRGDFILKQGDKIIGCVRGYYEIVPRRKH